MSEALLLYPTQSGGTLETIPRRSKTATVESVTLDRVILDIVSERVIVYYSPPNEPEVLPKRTTDFEWFLQATKQQAQFKGKYVAIHVGEIIATGETFKEALDKGRKKLNGKVPLISFIPKDEALEV